MGQQLLIILSEAQVSASACFPILFESSSGNISTSTASFASSDSYAREASNFDQHQVEEVAKTSRDYVNVIKSQPELLLLLQIAAAALLLLKDVGLIND